MPHKTVPQLPGPVPVALAVPWTRDPGPKPYWRCTLADGRELCAWKYGPYVWNYSIVCDGEVINNSLVAPNRMTCQADALSVATWLVPSARPTFDKDYKTRLSFNVHPVSGDGAEEHNNLSSEPAIAAAS